MWSVEAQLVIRRDALGGPSCRDETVTVGRTRSRDVVQALMAELLRVAGEESDMWGHVDPVLGRLAAVERERLERLIDALPEPGGESLSGSNGSRG